MKKWMLGLLFVALACGGSTTEPVGEAQLEQEFDLQLGESAIVEGTGLTITFAHVREDSRCPPMAYCFWAGNARIALDVERSGEPEELFDVCTNAYSCSRTVSLGAYELALVELRPSSTPRTALQYRATLRVSAAN